MKILSLYIVGFGKFVNQSLDFTKDITVIKQDNGWGKTTLADFIECMLFGMDNARSKAVENNPRIKYAPFTGGAFGGSLTLVFGGKTYRIERQFGKTVAQDRACVYDENNACLSATEKNGEPFGEMLLKINRETYKKSAYISQLNGDEKGLPADAKSRLLALLSVSNQGGSADIALEKLDQAERNLRAKRKPAKGKLDSIDERIDELYRLSDECLRAEDRAREYAVNLKEIQARLSAVETQLDELQRKKETQIGAMANAMFVSTLEEAKEKLNGLSLFFAKVEKPESINIDGLKETYARYQTAEKELVSLEESLGIEDEQTLKERLEETETLIRSYESMQAQTPDKPKKKRGKKRFFAKYLPPIFGGLGLFLMIFGGAYLSSLPVLGYPLFAFGIVSLIYAGFGILKGAKSDKQTIQADGYAQAIEKRDNLRTKLQRLQNGDAWQRKEELNRIMNEQAKTLNWFFGHFVFPEGYTYPVMIEKLEENIALYEKCKRTLSQTGETTVQSSTSEDMTALRFRIIELNSEKTSLTEERVRIQSALEREEKIAGERSAYLSEIGVYEAEKSRLESRLTAIRSARELLIRSRENMATKYLAPVEKSCQNYLSIMGFAPSVIFDGSGETLIRENGRTVAREYYSVGLNETVDLCLQLALYDTLFTGEKPPLVLDDPLVNLDDEKTDKAKRLLRSVAKDRQVIYFTCKSERIL